MRNAILQQHTMDRYARSCAARAGMGVVWKHDIQPACDGKTIYLPAMNDKTSDQEMQDTMHFIAHEVGHYQHTDFNAVQNVPKNSKTEMLLNMIEDHRINYLNATSYAGDAVNDNAYYCRVLPEILPNIKEAGDDILNYIAWDKSVHADYAHGLHDIEWPALNPEMQKKLAPFSEELRRLRSIEGKEEGTKASLNLAKKILESIDPEQAKKDQQQEEENAKGDDGKGGDEEGDKKGAGKKKSGEGEGDGEPKEGEGKAKNMVQWDKIMKEPNLVNMGNPKVELRESTEDKGAYQGTPPSDIEVCRVEGTTLVSNKRTLDGVRSGKRGEVRELYDEIMGHTGNVADVLANKVRAKLQIISRVRTNYAQKKGKLHGAGLHRLFVKDAGGYSERVFKNKTDTNTLDVSVALLIDTSGSMSGDKYSHAIKATVMLNNVLGNVLKVPIGIYGFSTTYNYDTSKESLSMAVFRKYADKTLTQQVLEDSMCVYGMNTLMNNPDGEAMLYVYNDLMRQKSKRHVFIMLSDGAPAAHPRSGNVESYTQEVAKHMIGDKRCECYGIGILSSSIKRIIPNSVVLHRPEDLENCLLSLLDKTLMGGK